MLLGTHNLYTTFIQTSKLFVFVPPNPTCVIQPTDWSAIATLKQFYFRRVHNQAIRETDREETLERV